MTFFILFYYSHISYLGKGRFDYTYNMQINLMVGKLPLKDSTVKPPLSADLPVLSASRRRSLDTRAAVRITLKATPTMAA